MIMIYKEDKQFALPLIYEVQISLRNLSLKYMIQICIG